MSSVLLKAMILELEIARFQPDRLHQERPESQMRTVSHPRYLCEQCIVVKSIRKQLPILIYWNVFFLGVGIFYSGVNEWMNVYFS